MRRTNYRFRWFIIHVCRIIVLSGIALTLGILFAYILEVFNVTR